MDTPDSRYDKIILGIDPGTNIMGYGLLGIRGKTPCVIVCGVIKLSKFESHYTRLGRIYERISSLISQYSPDEMAIEAPFFGKNVQSMLKLGRAQGVAMAAAISRDIPIHEYAPLSIKQAVTGSGSATKERVAAMLKNILHIPADEMPKFLDATDALAAALTHHYESIRPIPSSSKAKNWKEFLAKNPERLAQRRGK